MPSIPCRAVEEEPSAEDEADAEGDNNEDEGSEEEENSPPTAERVARYEAHRREQKRLCAQARRKQMRTALFQESVEPDDASEACGRLPTTLQIAEENPHEPPRVPGQNSTFACWSAVDHCGGI